MRILLSGGGTGGHVYPVLAVVAALKAMPAARPAAASAGQAAGRLPEAARPPAAAPPNAHAPDAEALAPAGAVEICYVGEAGGIEEALATRAGIPFRAIETGQIRGRAPWTVARNLARMARGARQCAALIRDWQPEAVFMTGGYVAAPVAWAAWRNRPRVPLLIYLPDLTPGQAIALTSQFAAKVAVSFPEVARYFGDKAVVTGYPVRPDLLAADKGAARAALGLEPDLPVVLVFGGSRGARSLNRALVAALPDLLPRCQVLHVSGQLDWEWVRDNTNRPGLLGAPWQARYHAYPYLHDEMVQALAAADLAVARAGASVLGEFPAIGLPSILAPYPYAGQHQDANAAYLADRGAARVIADADLGAQLAPAITSLLDAPAELDKMAQAARALAQPQAAANIGRELCRLAGYT